MSLFDDLRNLFQKDKKPSVTKVEPKIAKANPYGDGVLEKKAVTQPTVTNVPTKAESPARTIPKPPQEVPTGLKKNVPAGGTVVRQVGASQPSPPEILAHNDWVVKNAKTYSIRDLIENRYKVEEVFSGAMGYVYIGRDTRQRITFAIKQPKEAILADRDLFSRVLQEADAWTGLGMHPNIAYCYFVRAIEGVPHIFIEYVDGGTLEEWISDRRCTDYKVGLDMAIQFCHGLERAHERGMIHRDIKPRNVLVTKGGQVKVTDFGLVGAVTAVGKSGAKRGGDEHGTRMGDTMGTHAYMSPEQFNDPRHKSAEAPKGVWYESDIYSFGVCMWEMFCGRRPYEVSIEVKDGAPDPRDLKRDISDGLRTLLLRSVEFDRSKRQQNFSELREELNAIFRELYGTDAPHYRLELHDTTADELNNQGYSYYELGREVEARKCFEAAVTANSTHSEAVFNLALLQWRAGEIDDIVVLRRIRSCLNPAIGKEKISELQGYIHAERFDPVSAKELLKLYPTRFEEIFGQSMIGTIGLIRTFEGHSKWVTCLSPSVDGKYALSGSGDNTLKLWEIGTGKCLRTFNGHSDGVRSVSLSGNARYALSGSNDKTLKLWEVETGECLRTFMGHRLQVTSLSQGTNDRYVLSGSNDGTLKLWDVQTGECLRTFEGHSSGVQSVCLSGNGKCALSGSFDHTLKLWDIKTGSCLRTFEGHNDFVQDVTLSADSRYALGSWDNTMKLWNLATGECLRTFEGGGGHVSLSFDGKYALSGSRNNTFKMWEVGTGRCLRTFDGHSKSVTSLNLSANGRYILSGSYDNTLKLWEVKITNAAYVAKLQISGFKPFEKIKEIQDDLRLAIDQAESLIKRGLYLYAYQILYRVWEEADFRDDQGLLRVYQKLYDQAINKTFNFGFLKNTFQGHKSHVYSVCLSSDGKYVLSGSLDNTLILWDLETGRYMRTFEGHSGSTSSVCMSADGRYAISGGGSIHDATIKMWEVETGQCLRTFTGHTIGVCSLSLSVDGKYVLSGSWDKTLKLWELSTGQCLRTFEGHTDWVNAVTLCAESRYALSGSGDRTLKLWDIATGECLRTIEGHSDGVNSVSCSPDGRFALSGSSDCTLSLWEIATGERLRTFEGHSDAVFSVSLSADGSYALSGSADETIKLWDVLTGRCLHTFEGHSYWVSSVSLSADGKYAISGSWDNTLKLWRLIWKLEFD